MKREHLFGLPRSENMEQKGVKNMHSKIRGSGGQVQRTPAEDKNDRKTTLNIYSDFREKEAGEPFL